MKAFPPSGGGININPPFVIIVCDHSEIASIWAEILQRRQIGVLLTRSPDETLRRLSEHNPSLIVIDLIAKYTDEIGVAREIRSKSDVPLLLFTPRNNEAHILEAYQAGVDECVIKPISPALFLAKVMVWLYRSTTSPETVPRVLEISGIQLDVMRRKVVTCMGTTVKLSNLEFRLLYLLMQHPGWLLETDRIILGVWGYYKGSNSSLLKNLVLRLRRKIEPDPNRPCYIYNEPGIGYRFLGED